MSAALKHSAHVKTGVVLLVWIVQPVERVDVLCAMTITGWMDITASRLRNATTNNTSLELLPLCPTEFAIQSPFV